ncbi:GILT-like protein 1 [Neocloeon triangulifer]|uniref:GILT-like protein 1 n=1 Tax=Neocloeon triangulifer TaxID=2078957 RepID=UPI00286ED19C|nr:GILT-like protein 1 [Neocloeon triangulifer]
MATAGIVGAFFLLLASLAGADDAVDPRVHLKVYYESLCPDSVRFVRNQLIPTWNSLGSEFLEIDFLPFGKAKSERKPGGGLSFTCQHGPRECAGNMVQACGLSNLLSDHDLRIKFVGCLMNNSDPPSAGAKCAPQVGLDYKDIEECVNSPAAEALLYNYEQRTLKLFPKGLAFVPSISINGKFDQEAQNTAQRDLKSVVCAYIPESVRPAQCL